MYFDYNATSPLRPTVRKFVEDHLDLCGNPSSVHAYGRTVRGYIEKARGEIAKVFETLPKNITFTSGATEANNMVVAGHKGPLILSAIEHDSLFVAACVQRSNTFILNVTQDGVVDTAHLEELLGQTGDGTLVCIMSAHNETGAIQPISLVADICARYKAFLHVDMVQSLGRISLNMEGVHSVTFSGHKIGSLTGVGAFLNLSDKYPVTPLIRGGGQERSFRSGTENVLGILSMGAAITDIQNDDFLKISRRINRFEAAVMDYAGDHVTIFSKNTPRLGNTCNLAMHFVKSELQLMHFDALDLAVSTGSACSSGKVKVSRSLLAMNVPESIAACALRISIGFATTDKEIDALISRWKEIYTKLSPHAHKEPAQQESAAHSAAYKESAHTQTLENTPSQKSQESVHVPM